MKCGDVRTFFTQIAEKSVTAQIAQQDIDYFVAKGYLNALEKSQYEQLNQEVAELGQLNEEEQKEITEERAEGEKLSEEERKTHSILFHFEGKEKRQEQLESLRETQSIVDKEREETTARDSRIKELIQKKSFIDRMVPYGDRYFSLTGQGVLMLNDLNVRNYRLSDEDFSVFVQEASETSSELRSIAERGKLYESKLSEHLPDSDQTLLWGTSIGLAKVNGDVGQIGDRFLTAFQSLGNLHSTVENKLMAAEIITSVGESDSKGSQGETLDQVISEIEKLDHELRHHADVPKELSAGIAAIVLYGRRFDGTYPLDRFSQFSGLTSSYESAAILSVINVPAEELADKFRSFKALYESWGYQTSDDTELSSAFLAVSGFSPDDVKTKLTIITDALKAYLEYPLVAAAVLASITVLEANETLDLMEKAFFILSQYAVGLERSELLSLAVRMIHGIRNELVKELDSTAKIVNTPVQFTYAPSGVFFIYNVPILVAHASYYSTFSGIGGFHPAHVHGVGGFAG